jgi:hypothetical protein
LVSIHNEKIFIPARHALLTSIILVTWEAENRRTMVPGQCRPKKVSETPISREKSWV